MRRKNGLIMALLGFSSGLALFLITAAFVARMADCGVDVRTIGLLSLTGIPYIFKFVWTPFFDVITIPVLGPRLGRRRSVMLVSQVGGDHCVRLCWAHWGAFYAFKRLS